MEIQGTKKKGTEGPGGRGTVGGVLLVSSLLAGALLAPPLVAEKGIPRTASGKPDLTGTYDLAALTPFERDPQHGESRFMPDDDARAVEAAAAAGMAAADAASDPDREAPPAGGDGSAGAAGSVGGYNAFWVDPGTRMLKIDGRYLTSIVYDPPNGRLPPISQEGERRRSTLNPYAYPNTGTAWWLDSGDDPYDGPESLSLLDRCLYVSVAGLPARPILYNNVKRIVQTEDHVMILVEWMHDARIVRLDSEHLPREIRSLSGDSIGWWEGDTLVVETTNFLAVPNTPREGLRIVERFTRLEDGDLLYDFTVHDPDYTAPYSGSFPWPATQDRLYEYACHEGNYAMGGILRGARLLEKEWREKKTGSSDD